MEKNKTNVFYFWLNFYNLWIKYNLKSDSIIVRKIDIKLLFSPSWNLLENKLNWVIHHRDGLVLILSSHNFLNIPCSLICFEICIIIKISHQYMYLLLVQNSCNSVKKIVMDFLKVTTKIPSCLWWSITDTFELCELLTAILLYFFSFRLNFHEKWQNIWVKSKTSFYSKPVSFKMSNTCFLKDLTLSSVKISNMLVKTSLGNSVKTSLVNYFLLLFTHIHFL